MVFDPETTFTISTDDDSNEEPWPFWHHVVVATISFSITLYCLIVLYHFLRKTGMIL